MTDAKGPRDDRWYLSLMSPNTKGPKFAWLDPTSIYINAAAFSDLLDDLVADLKGVEFDVVGGCDAMGFVLGAGLAARDASRTAICGRGRRLRALWRASRAPPKRVPARDRRSASFRRPARDSVQRDALRADNLREFGCSGRPEPSACRNSRCSSWFARPCCCRRE